MRESVTRSAWIASALVGVWGLALGLAAGASDADAPPPDWSTEFVTERFPDPDAGAELTTGVERCSACHDERRTSLAESFHEELIAGPAGCEACHGDGAEHARTDGDARVRHPWDAPAREVAGMCLRCHADVVTKPVRGHREWVLPEGTASASTRSCTECHEIHVDREAPQHAESTGPFPDVAALDAAAEPIPAARCIACHPTFHPEMARSGHAELVETKAACGTCHGAGSLHELSGGRARLIVNPARQAPKRSSAGCLSCHEKGDAVQRWTCSVHAKEGVGCVTCHDANAARGRTLRGDQFTLCGGCHLDVRAKLRLPNHHDVERGRVQCTDCHDPHEDRSRVRDADVRRRSCENCHREKSGPFLHDHGIKRTEGCVACHDPHGSVNRRMLSFARIKPFCLQCHAETSHDLASRRYDNCLACHTEIHGSDLDRLMRR